jgi:hypothetical protein
MFRRSVRSACLIAVVSLAGDCRPEHVSGPTGTFSLSGHVRLVGSLVDAGGKFAGTRTVDDANGVRVELRFGHQVLGATSTVGGVYRFSGLVPGAYHTAVFVTPDVSDETTELTLANRDLVSGDLLTLRSAGDLYPVPNPTSGPVRVLFSVSDTAVVEIRVLDMQGSIVQHVLSRELLPGPREADWNGLNDQGAPASGALYWFTFEAGNDQRAQLLFR